MFNFIVQKLHREGYRFVAIAAVITFILLLISKILGLIGLVISIWIYYFFRDPERFSINDENYLVSPADGKITQIIETNGPKELGLEGKKYTRISIFMDVLCCHVNRVPYTGTVAEIFYKPGKFINATLDKASEDNERNYLQLKNLSGDEIIVVQIAGMIARRIVCDVKKGDTIKQGDRLGMIRFGSKVDLYFENYNLLVRKGQNTVAGETLLAIKK
jgi:phosphatidylserine decarboxylase